MGKKLELVVGSADQFVRIEIARHIFVANVAWKEGRGCHARDAIEAYGVKRSASVTGFVLAEGTHQTDVFSANFHRYELTSMTQGGGSLTSTLAGAAIC